MDFITDEFSEMSSSTVTVSSQMILFHLERFKSMGGVLPEDGFLGRLGLTPELLENSKERYPIKLVSLAVEYAAQQLNDPILGLNHVEKQDASFQLFLEELLVNSATIAEFVWLYSRYICILTEIGTFEIVYDKQQAAVHFIAASPEDISYHQYDGAAYILKKAIHQGYGILPSLVLREQAAPNGYADEYKKRFGCPVLFEQTETALIFNTEDLIRPTTPASTRLRNHPADQLTHTLTPRRYQRLLEDLYGKNIEDEIMFLIRRLLIRGEPSRNQIASEMMMSVRTLQRTLSQMNTSYKELLEKTRKSLALDYLQESSFTIAQVALLLGYTETSQFYKAFRRWFGYSPSETLRRGQ